MTTLRRSAAALSGLAPLMTELGLPPSAVQSVYQLSLVRDPAPELPDRATADAAMRTLGFADDDRAEALDARPDADDDALLWLFERCGAALVAGVGTVGPLAAWPDLPDELGARGRYLYTWVFLAAMPAAQHYHREHDISDDDSIAALSVLTAQMNNRRALHGAGGLHTQNWVTHHFRGAIYVIGRLHFERTFIGFDAGDAEGAPAPGEPALSLHIPEGRLTPDSVDSALERAAAFFRAHFPDEHYRVAMCTSWVLDPQLAGYLAPDTNLIRFQRRFHLVSDPGAEQNSTAIEFIFKRDIRDLATLPRASSLQRGVIGHIEAGRHWYFRTGWLDLAI